MTNFAHWTMAEVDAHNARVSGKPITPTAQAGVEREADLHHLILLECKRRGWIALHGSMAQATARSVGEPDFTILADKGRVFFVECKSRTGKLRPEQQALKHWADRLGHTVHVVRSLREFVEVVNL